MTNFAGLVGDYLSAVEKALALFDKTFGRRDLIKAWREDLIPQAGELAEGAIYEMHGIGCWVNLPEAEVDFDFAYSNEIGFDAWRLWSYANQFPDRYAGYKTQEDVERALADAVEKGAVERFENYPRLLKLRK